MKIDTIKQKNINKYEVVIDNEKHIILGDVLLECNILKPRVINENEYSKIISLNEFYIGYNKIINYISYKMRNIKEIKNKLDSLDIDKNNQIKIIEKLKKDGYLDNDKYVESYINDQINLTLNGPNKIIFNLKKLGFKEYLINNYLPDDNNIWEDKVAKIIDKKIKSNHNLSKNRFVLNLQKYLKEQGYNECHYSKYIDNIDFDDSFQMKKDYNKLYLKYSKKYSQEKLKYILKQKMYALGYDVDKL